LSVPSAIALTAWARGQLVVTIFGGPRGSRKSMTKNAVAHFLQPDAAELSADHLGTLSLPFRTLAS
jgi:hypothetical protein